MKITLRKIIKSGNIHNLKEDIQKMTADEAGKKWGAAANTIYFWARKLDIQVKRKPACRRPSLKHRGFVIFKSKGHWFMEGSIMCHSKKEIVMKFIDTYLRRTGKMEGKYAT